MTACYLRAFGSNNLGKARGISSPIVAPLQPIGILITSILIGFQDTYFVAFNIMGCFAIVAVFLASQICEPQTDQKIFKILHPKNQFDILFFIHHIILLILLM